MVLSEKKIKGFVVFKFFKLHLWAKYNSITVAKH